MQKNLYKNIAFNVFSRFYILLVFFSFIACNNNSNKVDDYNRGYKVGYLDGIKIGRESGDNIPNNTPENNRTADPNLSPVEIENPKERIKNPAIPQKAVLVLNYIRKNNQAPDGYEGGRYFGNYEKNLPQYDAAGNKINYQEWDIRAKEQGKSRGAQRIVTGSDGSAWYTPDHYSTFIEIK